MDEQGKQEMLVHLKQHQKYPATKEAIIAACNHLEHVPADARTWVQNTLAARTYNSANDVIKALGL